MLKKIIVITLVFSALLLGIPFFGNGVFSSFSFSQRQSKNFRDSFRLKFMKTGEVVEITALDYVTGCLFAQIPISYHDEALKAQAAAIYTYALRQSLDKETKPSADTKGYDVSDDAATGQLYFSASDAIEFYGNEYEQYYDKVRAAAEYGISHIIEYNGAPIYSVYHSVSVGITNTGSGIWGRNLPYLQNADSNWDAEFENYTCVNEMTIDTMRSTLMEYSKNISMPVDYNLWFTDPVMNKAGYVESIKAGDILISGGDMWRIFNLRSTSFTVRYTGSVFEFTTKGYGHGAGLSQFGADYMAKRGYTASEILSHYYSGVKII